MACFWLRRLCAVIAVLVVTGAWLGAAPNLEVQTAGGVSCMECHGSTPKAPILGARMTYDTSTHKLGGNSAYANGGGCQRCHTNEGFIDYVATGTVDANAFVDYPSQPGCYTCHAFHERGDLSLRTVAPVTLANKAVFDLGNGNLCATCHQSRVDASAVVVAQQARSITVRFGPHHGPQADLLAGTNAYQFEGKSYSSGAHTYAVRDGCVVCHMSLPDGRYGFSPQIGGHSFRIATEVHEAPVVNTSGCLACHPGIKQVAGKELFDIRSRDYDRDGTVEVVQDEVRGLLERFVNSAGTGLLQKLPIPFYAANGTFAATSSQTIRPVQEVGALFNYLMVLEDRSMGVHNPTYVVQILYDSISALDPTFDTSLRP